MTRWIRRMKRTITGEITIYKWISVYNPIPFSTAWIIAKVPIFFLHLLSYLFQCSHFPVSTIIIIHHTPKFGLKFLVIIKEANNKIIVSIKTLIKRVAPSTSWSFVVLQDSKIPLKSNVMVITKYIEWDVTMFLMWALWKAKAKEKAAMESSILISAFIKVV